MIERLISLFLIFPCGYAFGQDFESIIIQTWTHNEPPSQSYPHIFEIEYSKNEEGDLSANFYTVRAHKVYRKKLKEPEVIPTDKLIAFQNWVNTNKNTFSLEDLNIEKEELNTLIPIAPYQPHYQISNNFYVDIDSFRICNDYQFQQSISTGGFALKVILKTSNAQFEFFKYETDDRGQHVFDLKGYLCVQPLFETQIPDAFRIKRLFSRRSLLENILYYKNVVECEGYYYQEFINKHPERSKKENRTMVDWDYKKYLKERNKQYSN